MSGKPLTYEEKMKAFTEGLSSIGAEECKHCNGYGSSLMEDASVCSCCGGSGILRMIPKEEKKS